MNKGWSGGGADVLRSSQAIGCEKKEQHATSPGSESVARGTWTNTRGERMET
jgi:hypothetical protein